MGKGWPLGAPVCDVSLCLVACPYGVLGQVWFMIVSIPDRCLLYFLELWNACEESESNAICNSFGVILSK